jgi:2Fe-2S ferredoxin
MQQRVFETVDEGDDRLLTVILTLPDGRRVDAPAAPGFHIMEIIRAHSVPIKAECGGACVCSTCHVRVPAKWRDMLPPPGDEELARLDELPRAHDDSRLACQIRMTAAIDGLEIELQADSFKDLAPCTST